MHLLGFALLLAATPIAPPSSGGTVIERVVAVMRNPASAAPRPLTLTRLDEEARIALVSQGATPAAFAPLDGAARRAALRWVIDQWLVADEALRLKVDEAPREEVEAALQAFRQRFPDPASYRRFLATSEVPEEELQAILARGVRVQRFLDSRLGRSGRVSEDDVSRALAGKGVASPAPGEREAARARIAAERAQGQVKQILADLRSRADIRVLMAELRGEPAP
jgi:hypothetical protein